jgi:cell division protein FtsB
MRLINMMSIHELKKKIDHLETERTHITDEIKKLQIGRG